MLVIINQFRSSMVNDHQNQTGYPPFWSSKSWYSEWWVMIGEQNSSSSGLALRASDLKSTNRTLKNKLIGGFYRGHMMIVSWFCGCMVTVYDGYMIIRWWLYDRYIWLLYDGVLSLSNWRYWSTGEYKSSYGVLLLGVSAPFRIHYGGATAIVTAIYW